jgi:putative transposase
MRDNALAETEIGLFKTELIHRHGPWRGLDHVEIALAEAVSRLTVSSASPR